MANFSLVVDSKFDPFSYQELLHPVMMATQAHQQLEDQYNTLDNEAAAIGAMANEQTDPEAYKRYKTFADDLSNKAEELSKRGLTPTSRQGMLNLKTRYAKDITPIKTAYERRRALADEQRKMLAQNPTMLYQRMANTMSLDDLIKNPELDYGQQYSGALITQQVASAAANIAKEARDSEEGRRKLRQLIPYQYELVRQNGFSREAVEKAILGSKDADKILTGLVDNAIATSGVNTWGDAATRARALDYARQGLYSAIGQTDYQQITDQAGLARLQADLSDRNARRAEQRAAARAAQQQQVNQLAVNPMNLYSSKERGDIANKLKEYSKYFYKDNQGKWKMTLAGKNEYYRNAERVGASGYTGVTSNPFSTTGSLYAGSQAPSRDAHVEHTAFRKFMDSLGASKYMIKNVKGENSWQPGNMGNLWSSYVTKNNPDRYDATKATEFDYTIAGSQQGDMKDAIMTAARGTTLKEVDYDGKSKSFKNTGQQLKIEDLKKDKYKVTATRFSPYGTTVMIQDDKGNVKRYQLPKGINTYNEQNRDAYIYYAQQLQNVPAQGGYIRGSNGKKVFITREEADREYAEALQNAYLYHSQLGVQNKVKEQEFNPYGY